MQFPKFFGDISRTRTKQSLFAIFLTTRTIRAGGEWVRSRTRTTSAALDRLTNWLNIRKSIKPSTFFYFLSGDVSFLFLGFLSFWERYQVSLWVSPLNIWNKVCFNGLMTTCSNWFTRKVLCFWMVQIVSETNFFGVSQRNHIKFDILIWYIYTMWENFEIRTWLQFVLLAHWAAPKGRGAHLGTRKD